MWYRRLIYLLALAALVAFRLTNANYLARFLLVLALSLPLLSLLLAAIAALGCRVTLAPHSDILRRGEAGEWTVTVKSKTGLPLPRLTLRFAERNLLTGEKTRYRHAPQGGSALTLPAGTEHCGLLALEAKRPWLPDYLGLFSLPLPRPRPVRMLVAPVPRSPGPLNLPEGQGQPTGRSSTTTRTPGEDYDLRDYRPGDAMRAVHWKLSSKRDELIVREPVDIPLPFPLLALDRFGSPAAFELALDGLLGYSHALLEQQRPHGVVWLEGDRCRYFPISGERELMDCLFALLDHPIPKTGLSPTHRPDLVEVDEAPLFFIPIACGEEDAP